MKAPVVAALDLRDVQRHFAALQARALDLRPVWSALRRPLRDDQRDHAAAKAGPDGRWPARARSTEERARQMRRGRRRAMKAAKTKAKFTNRTRRQFRASRLLGSLPNRTVKVAPLPSSSGLVAYSMVRWSGVHQTGGTVGRGSRVPRREFLWISSSFLAQAAEAAAAHLGDREGGG